ncbi:alpha-tubulin N-acetyltransferase-like [Anopheles bellator]|uniref:alpha-tubulin N-acetyltransferase-like n=1 Tax=Anopheles bellator TaxID=139047 RepID=UPI0026492C02|nr:alpha-tubulin N-acetyltransferase-like [Anopheles bellator]XP_058054888.1 alpha-tubulin N-acetyltransferase-like [Anopheles bellator]XP_058054889.1 alpha-tubulin N-acetyltransferase-like [Anopheles bellator]XP_058054890.1 alpha-tubulin N-acetyltransferase-like [Anopheles bellator]
MEFRFNMHPLFRSRIVRINNSLLPTGFTAQSRRVALDATAQISEIINFVGSMSAQAQGLSVPVTTPQKLRNSDHHIYLMFEPNDKNGLVVGILKVGRKSLYVFDPSGETVNVTAPCVLDFYVHESRQRGGIGRELFEHMLREEHIQPDELAIDRPSEKLLGFLQKHYGLSKKIPQMNNFVVYEGFFASKEHNSSDIDGRRMHITASPNTNLFGPTFTTTNAEERRSTSQTRTTVVSPPVITQPPVGRYAAKRPSCSMAQIIHNSPTTVSAEPNSTNATNTNANGHANGGANGDHDHCLHHHHEHGEQRQQAQQEYETDSIDGEQELAEQMRRVELQSASLSHAPPSAASSHTPHEVKFADEVGGEGHHYAYEDIPEPGPDPDPYDFHPHQLELSVGDEAQHDDGGTNRDPSLSPQSVSQQATPEHPAGPGLPGSRKPARYTKQHTGLKNISFGVGAAVMPSGKMEFDQEENEGFGSVKINRPIGRSGGSARHGDNDNESVYSNGSQQGAGGGHFDLKFYHNKLW